MLDDFGKGKMEETEEELYSRDPDFLKTRRRPTFTNENINVDKDWEDSKDLDEIAVWGRREKTFSMFRMVFLLAGVFFVGALLFAGLTFYRGSNVVSSNNIDISVIGPSSISGGEILPLEVFVTNGNSVSLRDLKMRIDYPEGSRHVDDASENLLRENFILGDVESGESVRQKINFGLFGEEKSIK